MRTTVRFGLHVLCVALVATGGFAQEKITTVELLRSANSGGPDLAQAISQTFKSSELSDGTAVRGHLSSFVFAIEAESKPTLTIDGAAGPELRRIPATKLWYAVADIPKQG